MRTYYYKIFGKNRHVRLCHYSAAPNQASAKIDFYLNAGTDIFSIIKITEKQYLLKPIKS